MCTLKRACYYRAYIGSSVCHNVVISQRKLSFSHCLLLYQPGREVRAGRATGQPSDWLSVTVSFPVKLKCQKCVCFPASSRSLDFFHCDITQWKTPYRVRRPSTPKARCHAIAGYSCPHEKQAKHSEVELLSPILGLQRVKCVVVLSKGDCVQVKGGDTSISSILSDSV
jgi:hypothetical protein